MTRYLKPITQNGEVKFEMHKYQARIMASKKRYLFALAGIQSGKTITGCMWLIREILKGWDEKKDYSYLIAAPTYKILQQSTIRKWLEMCPPWFGEYKEQKSVFELADGRGIIYIRSTEEPYGLEGMTLKAAWLDEAGQMADDVWRIIQGRLSILQGRLIATTTPYIYNWVEDITSGKTKRDDVEVVKWESIDSPWFPKAEYYRQKKLAEGDPALWADFEKRYKGVFRRVSGRVYSQWSERYIINDLGEIYLKEVIGGIDWGYTQPAAVTAIGFTDEKPMVVILDEWYQSGKVIDEIAAACLAMMNKYNVRLFYADPSRPDYIQDLANRRIPVMPGNNDMKMGIAQIQRLIKTGNLNIMRNCPHLLEEMELYHYPEAGDEQLKELPVMTKDHALDSIRYPIITHMPIEVVETKEEKPIWKLIHETNKAEVPNYEEEMEDFMID